MKILKFNDYYISKSMTEDFIDYLCNPKVNESIEQNEIKKILSGLSNDLKFNYNLIFTFGIGIKALYPVVDALIKNSNIRAEITTENIILLTTASLFIIFLEEKNKSKKNITVTRKDIKTILEELKLRGFGNGIVKKIVNCYKSINNIIKVIFKNSPYALGGILEMIGYTSLLIPTMNAVDSLIGKYHMTIDNLPENFLSLGIGVISFVAKNGLNYLINKLKDKLDINLPKNLGKHNIVPELIPNDNIDIKSNDELIKEQ